MKEPVFGKREPRSYDYQEMTWSKFINLRKWAKKAVEEIGYPIYLVGSTLQKELPRDFDILIAIPLSNYEEMFGEMTEDNVYELIGNASRKYVKHYFDCVETLGECGHVSLDFKVYPDHWFPEKDRLLLAAPALSIE